MGVQVVSKDSYLIEDLVLGVPIVILEREEENYYINKYNESKIGSYEREIAFDKLLGSHLKLIKNIAGKNITEHKNNDLDLFRVLINAGISAFRIALAKYDANKGAKLSTYARYFIKRDITRCFQDESDPIRKSYQAHEARNKIRKIADSYGYRFDDLSQEDLYKISEESGISIENIRNLINIKPTLSLFTVNADGIEENFLNSKNPQSQKANELENAIKYSFLQKEIGKLLELSGLTEREKIIIEKRYGLNNTKEYSLKEIAKEFGRTQHAVNSTIRYAKRKLKKKVKEINEINGKNGKYSEGILELSCM